MNKVHLCSFSTTDELRGKSLTYANVKACVLRAGRFSCFEASENRTRAVLFTNLCHDPEIETFDLGYPWTGVRRKNQP